jgi:uncharacterized protein involved in response to NO
MSRSLPIAEPSPAGARRFALFDYGFRPFFLLAGLWGAAALLLWLAFWFGRLELAGPWQGVLWHAHEMIFGFAIAGVAGFLLTAVPGWTATEPLRGAPLAALALLWLAGRAVLLASAALPPLAVAVVDLAFLPALALPTALALFAGLKRTGSARNFMFLALLGALETGNLLTHLEALGWTAATAEIGLRLGLDTLLLMITLVGGRILPAFTRNALRQAGIAAEVRSDARLDALAIAGMAALLLGDLVLGPGLVTGVLAFLAGAAGAVRLYFWRPFAAARGRPLLWVLHLGYGWLVLGLLMKGLADATGLLPATAALHALTIGAVGTMLMAVMSRASLGHTGRPLVAPRAVAAAYVLLTVAALLRVVAPLLPDNYNVLLAAAGCAWALAFALFSVVYLPILTGPRTDGGPG